MSVITFPSARVNAHARLDALMDAEPYAAEHVCCILAAFKAAKGSRRRGIIQEASTKLLDMTQ